MVRVGMMNPDNLSRIVDRLLPAWTSPKAYQFLHLPVQSGSPAMLEAMNRGYLPEDFVSLAEKLRRASPRMTLATDIIVGFPGETEEDHRSTVDMLKEVRPDIVNVTRFSPRQGTPAARARNQVPGWVAKERSREITKLRFEISQEINGAMIGSRERITITEEGKAGTVIGRTSSYKPVVVKGWHPMGSTMEVEIIKSAATHLFGEPR
jgi:MiaB/RimO family radical SAM methylthiotransferase